MTTAAVLVQSVALALLLICLVYPNPSLLYWEGEDETVEHIFSIRGVNFSFFGTSQGPIWLSYASYSLLFCIANDKSENCLLFQELALTGWITYIFVLVAALLTTLSLASCCKLTAIVLKAGEYSSSPMQESQDININPTGSSTGSSTNSNNTNGGSGSSSSSSSSSNNGGGIGISIGNIHSNSSSGSSSGSSSSSVIISSDTGGSLPTSSTSSITGSEDVIVNNNNNNNNGGGNIYDAEKELHVMHGSTLTAMISYARQLPVPSATRFQLFCTCGAWILLFCVLLYWYEVWWRRNLSYLTFSWAFSIVRNAFILLLFGTYSIARSR